MSLYADRHLARLLCAACMHACMRARSALMRSCEVSPRSVRLHTSLYAQIFSYLHSNTVNATHCNTVHAPPPSVHTQNTCRAAPPNTTDAPTRLVTPAIRTSPCPSFHNDTFPFHRPHLSLEPIRRPPSNRPRYDFPHLQIDAARFASRAQATQTTLPNQ